MQYPAGGPFDPLRARDKRIGTNDLAIAAITLAANGTLVTRNFVDFERVSGFTLKDPGAMKLKLCTSYCCLASRL